MLDFKTDQAHSHQKGNKLLEQTVHKKTPTDRCNHRLSRAMSMKHLSGNYAERAQGIKTGWAREICKTVFQTESLQMLLPGVVGKRERERGTKRKRETVAVEIETYRVDTLRLYTNIQYVQPSMHKKDFKDGKRIVALGDSYFLLLEGVTLMNMSMISLLACFHLLAK